MSCKQPQEYFMQSRFVMSCEKTCTNRALRQKTCQVSCNNEDVKKYRETMIRITMSSHMITCVFMIRNTGHIGMFFQKDLQKN